MEVKEIKAREGYYLTQATEGSDRIFVKAIKGANINEADWREATEQEKNDYEKSISDYGNEES